MKKILTVALLIFTFSCSTTKTKSRIWYRSYHRIYTKYSINGALAFSIPDSSNLNISYDSINKSSKKQIKRTIKIMERIIATAPDSTQVMNNKIDSFYFNKNKIKYMKKKKLISHNVFIDERIN